MNGAASVWAITPEERGKHDKQFDSLAPALGHVSGEQARKFFLQSGLPPPVLAEIWALADLDCDGKMDRLEFSIAMKLIKLKLQGRGLPTSLPIVMKQSPAANPASIMTSSSRFGMGSMPNLSLLVPSMPSMSILTPVPVTISPSCTTPVPGQRPMMHTPMTLPLMSSLGNAGLPNGHAHLLTPSPVPSNTAHPMSGFSSPTMFSPSTGMSQANSLLDLGSSSSNSSSTNSLASNSPKTVTCDWAVPQAARLKYRQQFNTLDKLMSGYLSGPQVRNALLASNLTQTQLAAIWTLADVDRDGQLRADEFILAMHLVDMAKTGHPLPLSLPQDLVPPSLRSGGKGIELVNGTGPYPSPSPADPTEMDLASKVSFEDKLKENFARGSAELEKRRLALEEERRRERERRDREQREAQERREREARELENRRRLEEERRLERQREMERQREEERLRELERKEELERRRKEEWERGQREELSRRKGGDQEEIVQLKARKKCLEIELEAVGSKHKQISDRLRDAQSKRRIQKSELDLINQKRDVRIAEINTLQVQFEDWQRKLSQLVPEQQRLTERLRCIGLNNLPSVTLATLGDSVTEKGVTCRRLKDQLDTLERETADKLGQMEQYNKELKFGDMDDCLLRSLLSLLTCLSQLFLLIKELREKQVAQQASLDDLCRVKEQKQRELQRRREEEGERKRREEEEAARQARLEQARREQARRDREEEEEAERQRRLLEEQRAKQREEEEREAQARLRAAQEKAQEEERRRREHEEEEEEKRRRQKEEEEERRRREKEEKEAKEEQERRRKEEEQERRREAEAAEEEKRRKEEERMQKEEERRRREQQQQQKEAGGGGASVAVMTLYRALYPFVARNADELSLEGSCLIEVDEATVGEPGWLCGSYRGNRGWFPQSYAERCAASSASSTTTNTTNTTSSSEEAPPASQAGPLPSSGAPPSAASGLAEGAMAEAGPSRVGPPVPQPSHHGAPLRARAVTSWSSSSSDAQPDPSTRGGGGGDSIAALLSFSQGDVISVLQQTEDWWLGQLAGTQGWFPKDYVTLEPDNTDAEGSDTLDSVQLEDFVALYTYESPEAGDLTFDEGDVVMVTEREGEWWRGSIGDRAGVFPSNYVRPVEPEISRPGGPVKKPEIAQALVNTVAPTAQQLSLSPGQLIVVLAKNSTGWWLGELQARGKKRQRGWFHSSNVKLLGPTSGKSTPSPLPVCQVITMYDYTAANQDELSFSKGQLISVLDKTNPDWWKGEVNGVAGLLPTNYVKMTTESDPSQQWCADLMSLDSMTPQERKRQGYIHELIQTEETYVEDLELVLEVFHKPMSESGRLTPTEMGTIFVNWRELIMCNTKLLKALRVRKKTGGENVAVQVIGDLLAAELAHMQPYIRFCSCQLNAAALLQRRTNSEPDFKDFLKKIATNYRCKGMPLSSFLLKPMQRITRYPLLIKNILENTPEGHVDRGSLREALERAEELCSQVNEGVREKENSDRLEWIQSHVQCDGLIEHLVFNSLTNCLGPRKLLHSGRLHKTRGGRELWVFLFNDFLLLTHSPAKSFSSSSSSSLGADRLFSHKANVQLKMYKTPLFLNEVLVKNPPDPSSDEPLFHISHIDRVYTLKADTLNERTTWVQRIKAASEVFIETEKKKREKAYQARSLKTSGIGRLLVTVTEAQELKACKPNGKSNPYCELTMGAQCYTSRPLGDTLNPKWNFNCQFFVRDFYQDVLCITVFEKDQFSPDDFLGRTEVPVATIKKEMESKGAATRRLLLHEVPTGEVLVKLDLQLYEQTS
ncbi:LOW QUALITY PROTEIN: intersectin-2-like [Gadus macrocephalus]|uniref:LOW QUALITY PROTEIN: intersectin-2-like n=1 Tax=Gadus macrocephalus TaxID=80720 RepID=UPI0028CB9EC0|nr:LOW QUALITY PROTEIN: intersectin-2-like [Gadus macrocephalus]